MVIAFKLQIKIVPRQKGFYFLSIFKYHQIFQPYLLYQPTKMNILNILEELEKLLTEILLWIVLIPRTLIKIITKPKWVPAYIEEQVEKPSERFRDYMSPIILFLVNSLALFFILEYIVYKAGMEFYLPDFFNKVFNFNNVGDVESKLTDINTLLIALGFMLLPILFAVFVEVIRKKKLTRDQLKKAIYIQTYYFSPVLLVYFLAIIFYNILPFEPLVDISSYVLFILMFLWFSRVQLGLLRSGLGLNRRKAVTSYVVMIIILLITFTTYDAFSTINSTSSGSSFFDDLVVPETGEYKLSVRSRTFQVEDIDVYYELSKTKKEEEGRVFSFENLTSGQVSEQVSFTLKKGDTISLMTTSESLLTFFDLNMAFINDYKVPVTNDSLNLEPNKGPLYKPFEAVNNNEPKIHPKFIYLDSRPTENGEMVMWRATVFNMSRLFFNILWIFLLGFLIAAIIKGLFSKTTVVAQKKSANQ